MTGLEKILDGISAEGLAAAKSVTDKAEREAAALRAEAAREAEAECREIAKRAKVNAQALLARSQSGADLAHRRALLRAKDEIIRDVLAKSRTRLQALPADGYFSALVRLAAKTAHEGEGTLYLNAADLARMPARFSADLAEALGPGRSLSLASEARDIDGGFILGYGGVEENCSLEAIWRAGQEGLQDLVQKILFA